MPVIIARLNCRRYPPTHQHMPDEWHAFQVGLDWIGVGFRYLELKCLLRRCSYLVGSRLLWRFCVVFAASGLATCVSDLSDLVSWIRGYDSSCVSP